MDFWYLRISRRATVPGRKRLSAVRRIGQSVSEAATVAKRLQSTHDVQQVAPGQDLLRLLRRHLRHLADHPMATMEAMGRTIATTSKTLKMTSRTRASPRAEMNVASPVVPHT